MNFSIRHLEENGLRLITLREASTNTEITLLPDYGALLHAFRVRAPKAGGPDGLFNVIDSYLDRDHLEREIGISYKSCKLSPWPCRIPDGKYVFEGKEYLLSRLFKDGTAIHGLLYNKPFTVLEETTDETSASLVMEYRYNREDKGYPFDYACGVRYILHPDSMLEVVTTLTNLDDKVIPIADGWHPYFRLGGRVNDWQVQFHASAIIEFDERLVPTGKLLQYEAFDKPKKMGDTFLDNCFALKQEIVSASCELFNPANGLRVSFFPDASYPYLQLYTPDTRQSIAVENLSGVPDCFNNKMGLTLLEPGRSQIFTTRYKVSVE
ncbi:MAG TPA: aldose 1-epimerase [Puia sp.]|nr:aldose 1-epimerase [Puia sp.]